jgi:hypothetical protein
LADCAPAVAAAITSKDKMYNCFINTIFICKRT